MRRVDHRLGAHPKTHDGVEGTDFAVWAPNARSVSLVGEFNEWKSRSTPLRPVGATGAWEVFVPGVGPGERYQFEIVGADGVVTRRLDPCGHRTELRPSTVSVVDDPTPFAWSDADWMRDRATRVGLRTPRSVYEVHLGSWRRATDEGGRWLTWVELAHQLADHVTDLGFTHVELLPVMEHPFDGSWGYQVTGYFAPTARHGEPAGLKYLVDHLHRLGIGVILDWVPAHFPKDDHALGRFDGTSLYEHFDARQGEHPDWGTFIFNLGRREVFNFVLSSARRWIEDFHLDGLRVDALASMLYLDYSRAPGEWVPNRHGGRENLESLAFLRALNKAMHGEFPGVMVVAEESTSWPGVTRPVFAGGLGFTTKWNMGWMHDTRRYFSRAPIHRRWHHNELSFGLMYQWSEHFVLALSHDEVVHGKGSLLSAMPGDRWQRFANLRALYGWMWCHPGGKLLFMGAEIAQEREWDHDGSLDWKLLEDPSHAGVASLLRDLNRLYRECAPLSERDPDPEGFRWVSANDAEQSVYAFARFDAAKNPLLCVLNATPVVRQGYRLGVPRGGTWRERLNTDAGCYGGSDVGNGGAVTAEPIPSHGFPFSFAITLPPLGVLILAPDPATVPTG